MAHGFSPSAEALIQRSRPPPLSHRRRLFGEVIGDREPLDVRVEEDVGLGSAVHLVREIGEDDVKLAGPS